MRSKSEKYTEYLSTLSYPLNGTKHEDVLLLLLL